MKAKFLLFSLAALSTFIFMSGAFAQNITVYHPNAAPNVGFSRTIATGSSVAFPAYPANGIGLSSMSFAINNSSGANLVPGTITITGPNAADFTVSSAPSMPSIPAGTSTIANASYFTVTYNPSTNLVETAILTIPSNAINIPSYVINLTGPGRKLYGAKNPPYGTSTITTTPANPISCLSPYTGIASPCIGRAPGLIYNISAVQLAGRTTTYWGPEISKDGNLQMMLSLNGNSFGNNSNNTTPALVNSDREVLTFDPAVTTTFGGLAGGFAVFTGTSTRITVNFGYVTNGIRLVLQVTQPDDITPRPLVDPTSIGLSEQVGGLLQLTGAADNFHAKYRMEAFDPNLGIWRPYLDYYDDNGFYQNGCSVCAFITTSSGFYWNNLAPRNTGNNPLIVAEGGTGTILTPANMNVSDDEELPAFPDRIVYNFNSNPVLNFGTGVIKKSGVPVTPLTTFTLQDLQNNLITYEHNGSETIIDQFQFSAKDSRGALMNDGNPVNTNFGFGIIITPVNDPPVTRDTAFSCSFAPIPVTKTLVAYDPDNVSFTYSIVTNPTKGTISGFNASTGQYTYTPNFGAPTTDFFTFQAYDGNVLSNISTVNITQINQPPTTSNISLVTREDVAVSGTLTAADPELAAITFSVFTAPVKGVVTSFNATSGAFTYTPSLAKFGADYFTFKAQDAQGAYSEEDTVFIRIIPRIDPGDILVADQTLVRLFDPATSQDTIITKGQGLTGAINLAYKKGTSIFIYSGSTNGLVKADPVTGNQTPVAPPASFLGGGPIGGPAGMLINSLGKIIMGDGPRIISVDSSTGVVTPLFVGGLLATATGVVYLDNGDLIVTNVAGGPFGAGTSQIIRITPGGTQTTISSGGLIKVPLDLALVSQDTIVVSDAGSFFGSSDNIYKVCLSNGTIVPVSTGGNINIPSGLDYRQGKLYVVNKQGTRFVLDINPTSGLQTIVPGTALSNPWGLLIVSSLIITNVTTTDVTCTGLNDGTATISFTGGTAPYSYVLDGGTPVTGVSSPISLTGLTPATHNLVISDNAGESVGTSFTISTSDVQPPVLNCPANITTTLGAGNTQCGKVVTYTAPVGTDNCPGVTTLLTSGLASGSLFPVGINTVTYKSTDAAGNSVTCSFTVTVTDDTAPEINCPSNITTTADAGNTQCGKVVTYTTPVGTDNCPGATTTQIAGLASGVLFPVGVTTNTFRVTDASGNSVTCSFTVTVTDNTLPVIVGCPSNIIVTNGPGNTQCTQVVSWAAPTATDNCAVTVTQTGGPAPGSAFPVGTTTITYTATDASGNTAVCSFYVQVNSYSNGTIIGAANTAVCAEDGASVNISLNGSPIFTGLFNIAPELTPGVFGPGVPFGPFNVAVTGVSAIAIPGAAIPNATSTTKKYRITWISLADANNCPASPLSGSVDITVYPLPVISVSAAPVGDICPDGSETVVFDVTETNSVGGTFNWTAYDQNNVLQASGSAVAYGAGAVNHTFTYSCPANKELTFTFTPIGPITLNCQGHNVTRVVNIRDITPPVLTPCPANITVNTGVGNTLCSQTATWTAPTATDNCVTPTVTSNYAPGATFPVGTTTVTYTATDACGNSVSCSFTVTVVDNTPPAISCPGNITVNNTPGICGAAVTYTAPIGTDNCSGATTTQTAGLASGATFPVGVTTNTFVVTDAAGNTATCSFTVTVNDTEAPVIACPSPITVNNDPGICGAVVNYLAPSCLPGVFNQPGNNFENGWRTLDNVSWLIDNFTVPANSCWNIDSVMVPFFVTGSPTIATAMTLRIYADAGGVPGALLDTKVLAPANWTTTAIGSAFGYTIYQFKMKLPSAFAPMCSGAVPVNYWFSAKETRPSNDNNFYWEASNLPFGNNAGSITSGGLYTPVASTKNLVFSLSPTGAATVTDNCTACPTVVQTSGLVSGATFPVGVTTNTFVATDAAGNSSSCSFTVTVTDNTAPQITCPANITATTGAGNTLCGVAVSYTAPVGTDNCTGATTTQIAGLASGSLFPVGVTTNTFRVTDAAGNSVTCSFTVTVTDNTAPQITCPSNIVTTTGAGNTQCGIAVSYTAPVGTDNCSGATTTQIAGLPSGSLFPVGVTTNTFSVTDAVGNSVTCSFTVTVTDNTAPQITCPANITATTGAGNTQCGIAVSYTAPVGTDNCSGASTTQIAGLASGSLFPVGVTTNTFRVTDAAGNSVTCSFTVTVTDNTAPQITCPANITATTGAGNTQCGVAVSYTAPVGTDNCSGSTTTQIAGLASGSLFPVGVTTNTFRVSDAAGNSVTCSFTVTVTDNTAPQITCPSNIVTTTGAGNTQCGVAVSYTAPVGTDNCSGATTTQIAGLASGSLFPVGVTTNTFRVSDAAGNSVTCSFTVTVTDNTAPQITCPANIVTTTGAGNTQCGRVVSYTAPTGTDNCTGATTTQIAGLASGALFPVGVTTNTFRVSDAAGNSVTCSFTVTVTDNTAPQITCPANITATTGAGNTLCGVAVSYTAPVGTDNCTGATTTQIAGLASGSLFPVGVTTNTFRVTDAAGNSVTCSFTVTVTDNTAPQITCPSNIVTTTGAGNTQCGKVVSYTAPVGTDNCSGPSTTQIAGLPSGSLFPIGVTTNTFRVTDAAGNSVTCSFTVTVTDNTAPQITCPANIVTTTGAGNTQCGIAVSYTAPVGTDNCTGATTTQIAGLASGSLFPIGVTTNTFRVSDAAGNSVTCSFTVTVTDNTAPQITCPANIVTTTGAGNTQCGVAVSYTAPVGTDNCSGSTTTQIAGLASGSLFPVGVTTNTFRVSDAAGNSVTCSFTVTVTDNTAPQITCPANIVTTTGAGNTQCGRVVSYTAPVGTDNCTGATTTQIAGLASGSLFPVGVTTNTFRVSDAAGNSVTCSFTVTVTDNTVPVWTTAPNNLDRTVECSDGAGLIAAQALVPVATDNCPGTLVPVKTPGSFVPGITCPAAGTYTNTWIVVDAAGNTSAVYMQVITVTDTNGPTLTPPATQTLNVGAGIGCTVPMPDYRSLVGVVDCNTYTLQQLVPNAPGSPVIGYGGTRTVVILATDACGNTSTTSFLVNLVDATAPNALCKNITINLDANGNASITPAMVNNGSNDNCSAVTLVSVLPNVFNCSNVSMINTVTLTVRDASGNTATCTSIVTVKDITPPVITCWSDTTILKGPICTNTFPDLTFRVNATDACGIASVTQSIPQGTIIGASIASLPLTLTVTDVNGNTSACTFTVFFVDQTPPVITCPANVVVYTGVGNTQCSQVATWPTPVTSDNCNDLGLPTLTSTHTSGSVFPVGTTTVTYISTDQAGNTATCSFTVTVIDNTAPVINCPSNITVNTGAGNTQCGIAVSYTAPVGTDNCTVATTTQIAGLASGSLFPVGVTTNTFRVTDAAGNSVTCSFTVTVTDNTAPQITCPANIVTTTGAGNTQCGIAVSYTAPVGTDNCSGSTTTQIAGLASGSLFPVGVTTNTFRVTDAAGNSVTCSFTVTVADNTAPVLNCPANITTTTGAGNTQCGIAVTYAAPVGTDNCAGATTTQTAGLPSGSVFPVGVTTNTFVVTDVAGNSVTCSFTVTVADNTAPVLNCPANITTTTGVGNTQCGVAVTYAAPVGTDNCAGAATIQTAGLASGSVFPVGVTTNTFVVTDAVGNSATCSFTVTVADNTAPQINCPANITTTTGAGNTQCGIVVTYAAPVGTDNCAGATTTQTAGLPSGSVFPVGVTTNTFVVTDAAGNSVTCSFTVTVTDNTAPQITCPANIVTTTGAGNTQCGVAVSYTTPVGTDNCSGSTTTQIAGLASGSLFPVGVTTNTFSVTDAAGNSVTCSFTVTVTDNTAPQITCPANIVTTTGAGNTQCGIAVSYTAPVGTDNCSGSTTTQIAGLASGSLFPIGVTTNTFSVTDAAGNSVTCSFTVTVTDNTAPQITCPANIVTTTGAGNTQCGIAVSYTAPVGTDNCTGATTTQIAGLASGSLFPVGVTTNTFRVTDAAGNSVTCSFTVTVTDDTKPEFTFCPSPITNQAPNAAGCVATIATVNPVITDNCTATPTLTWTISGATTGSGTGNVGTFTFNVGLSTVTYTATDAAGNTRTCIYTVNVVNSLASGITGTATVAQNISTTSNITFSGANGTKPYTFTYNVNGGATQTISTTGSNAIVTVPQSNAVLGQYIYTLLSITDANGCTGTLPADPRDTITVVAGLPNLRPILQVSPQTITTSAGMELRVRIADVGGFPTTGAAIVVRIAKSSNFTFTWNPALVSTTLGAVTNSEWAYSSTLTNHVFTLINPGTNILPAFGSKFFGLVGTYDANGSNGSENITVTIVSGSGGETNATNNVDFKTVNFFN